MWSAAKDFSNNLLTYKFWDKPDNFLHSVLLVFDKARDFDHLLCSTKVRLQVSLNVLAIEEGPQEILVRIFFFFFFNKEGKGAENFRRKNKLGCCDGKVDRPIKSRVKINFQLLHIILLNFFYRDFCHTSIIFPNPYFWACFSGTFVYEANNVEPCFVFWRDTVKPNYQSVADLGEGSRGPASPSYFG